MSHAEMTIDEKDDREHLQLMSAALDGRLNGEGLLRHGLDVNSRTHEGVRIMFAVINMHADTVQNTLQFGRT